MAIGLHIQVIWAMWEDYSVNILAQLGDPFCRSGSCELWDSPKISVGVFPCWQ